MVFLVKRCCERRTITDEMTLLAARATDAAAKGRLSDRRGGNG